MAFHQLLVYVAGCRCAARAAYGVCAAGRCACVYVCDVCERERMRERERERETDRERDGK